MTLVRRYNGNRAQSNSGWNLANVGGMGNLFGDFDRLFNEMAALNTSQVAQGYGVDLYETDENIVLEMAVPGVAVEDLDISIEGRQLSIKGNLPENEDEGRRYWTKGLPSGQFSRTVTLPVEIDVENVEASAVNGILNVTLPKVAEAKARKITVKN